MNPQPDPTAPGSVPGPVVAYLDALGGLLTGSSEHVRRVLAEAEAHLLDAVAAHRAAGATDEEAVRAALGEFGTAAQVAVAVNRADWIRARGPVFCAAVAVVVRIAATGLVLAGVTAAASRLLAAVTSVQVVFGLPAGARVPAGACAAWLAGNPGAGSCQEAGTWEAAGDLTQFAGAAGVLGAALWAAIWWLQRRRDVARVLPPVLEPGLGLALFGAVAAGAAMLGASDAVVFTTWGAGMWWTGAACALLFSAGFGVRLWAAVSRSYRSLPTGMP